MFKKLPSNSEKILNEILASDNPTNMLAEHLNEYTTNQQYQKYSELCSILEDLEEQGYISINLWADNVPWSMTIHNSARTYYQQQESTSRAHPSKTSLLKKYDFITTLVANHTAIISNLTPILKILKTISNFLKS